LPQEHERGSSFAGEWRDRRNKRISLVISFSVSNDEEKKAVKGKKREKSSWGRWEILTNKFNIKHIKRRKP